MQVAANVVKKSDWILSLILGPIFNLSIILNLILIYNLNLDITINFNLKE